MSRSTGKAKAKAMFSDIVANHIDNRGRIKFGTRAARRKYGSSPSEKDQVAYDNAKEFGVKLELKEKLNDG